MGVVNSVRFWPIRQNELPVSHYSILKELKITSSWEDVRTWLEECHLLLYWETPRKEVWNLPRLVSSHIIGHL